MRAHGRFIFSLFMKRFFRAIAMMVVAMLVATAVVSCSKSKEFRVDAVSDDIGTQNVTLLYIDADGAFRQELVPAIDGKFSAVGLIDGPTYFEVLDASGRKLGEFIADGGDKIEARFSIENPENVSVKGNDDSELLVKWLAENRSGIDKGDVLGVNGAISAFVKEHDDQFVSTALLMKYFTVSGHEEEALQLLQGIDEKYRPGSKVLGFEQMLNMKLVGDSVKIDNIRMYSRADSAWVYTSRGARRNLVMLTDGDSRGADSIRKMVEAIKGVRITDMGCDRDTLLWKASLRNLPTDYPGDVERVWLPAGMATRGIAETAPADLPAFILTDSLGNILYRTTSTRAMARQLR